MSQPASPLSQLERRLRRVFVGGIAVSASLLILGLAAYFVAPAATSTTWLLNGGLLILMATPLLRVIVSTIEYIHLRDWFFVGSTLLVLVELSVTVIYALQQR